MIKDLLPVLGPLIGVIGIAMAIGARQQAGPAPVRLAPARR